MLALADTDRRRFAYGFWRWGADEIDAAAGMLALVRESGIDHLDTADVYGSRFGDSERLLGALRARAPELFAGAVIATKAGVEPGVPYNSSHDYLTAACETSLKRLGVERIDLFYIHRPDLLTHPAELAATLDALVSSGKIGAVGVSNFTAGQFEALSSFLRVPVAVHQIEYSAAHLEPLFDGTLDQAMAFGASVAAWSPLAGGRLGNASPGELAPVRDTLQTLATRAGVPDVAVALAFLMHHPAPVTPILGTKTPARLRDCLKAQSVTLSRREWYEIVEARRGQRMP